MLSSERIAGIAKELSEFPHCFKPSKEFSEFIQRIARSIEEEVIERCAQICDAYADDEWAHSETAANCAATIREQE